MKKIIMRCMCVLEGNKRKGIFVLIGRMFLLFEWWVIFVNIRVI